MATSAKVGFSLARWQRFVDAGLKCKLRRSRTSGLEECPPKIPAQVAARFAVDVPVMACKPTHTSLIRYAIQGFAIWLGLVVHTQAAQ
jgi:hypothetical protein